MMEVLCFFEYKTITLQNVLDLKKYFFSPLSLVGEFSFIIIKQQCNYVLKTSDWA